MPNASESMTHLFQALGQRVDAWRAGDDPLAEACHVMFADTTLHDKGKKAVPDFILSAEP